MRNIYTTVSGDTWDKIAHKALGDGFKMDRMIEENPEYVEMFVFPAGLELRVPDLEDEDNENLPEWYQ